MEMVILIGIQASGKSEYYHNHFKNTHLRLNLDMLKTRTRLNGLFEGSLEFKAKIVLDNTHPTAKERIRLIQKAKNNHYRVVGIYFFCPLEIALERNAKRLEPIPEKGVVGTFKKLEPPSISEGYDQLTTILVKGER